LGPAINNHGGYGRWGFLEIADPWNGKNVIRGFLRKHDHATPEVAAQ